MLSQVLRHGRLTRAGRYVTGLPALHGNVKGLGPPSISPAVLARLFITGDTIEAEYISDGVEAEFSADFFSGV